MYIAFVKRQPIISISINDHFFIFSCCYLKLPTPECTPTTPGLNPQSQSFHYILLHLLKTTVQNELY